MKKNILLALLLILVELAISQEKGHYLNLNLGDGLNKINYTLDKGNVKSGLGITSNIVYNYFLTPNWGIGTGIGIQVYKSTAKFNYMSSTPSVDSDGDNFEYRVYYSDWKEKQKMMMLEVPISLNYKRQLKEKLCLLVSVGPKISLPIKSSLRASDGEISTTGYFSQWNVELADMPQHNFRTINSIPNSEFASKICISGFVDLGVLYEISDRLDFFLSSFASYGFNDISSASNQDIYQEDGIYNGVLASNQISKANLLSLGLKAGIYIHIPTREKDVADENLSLDRDTLYKEPLIASKDTTTNEDDIKKEPSTFEKAGSVENSNNESDSNYNSLQIANIDTIAKEEGGRLELVKDTQKKDSTYKESVLVDTIPKAKESKSVNEDTVDYKLAKEMASQISMHFASSSSKPFTKQNDEIKELALLLKENPEFELHVVGHTCNVGSKAINMKLGQKRAESVKNLFVEQGVPESQITTESKYYLKPLVPNTSSENRAKNRRIELKILEKE